MGAASWPKVKAAACETWARRKSSEPVEPGSTASRLSWAVGDATIVVGDDPLDQPRIDAVAQEQLAQPRLVAGHLDRLVDQLGAFIRLVAVAAATDGGLAALDQDPEQVGVGHDADQLGRLAAIRARLQLADDHRAGDVHRHLEQRVVAAEEPVGDAMPLQRAPDQVALDLGRVRVRIGIRRLDLGVLAVGTGPRAEHVGDAARGVDQAGAAAPLEAHGSRACR